MLPASTEDKFSVLVSELQGFESSDSETEQEAVSLPQDALVIRPMNREDSTGPCDRDTVEEPRTLESPVRCEGDRMENFPFQDSIYVTIHHGSSGRRLHFKCYGF